MTIKKRLFCSNILMIAVPAVIAALVGLLCLALLWVTLRSGGGMRLEDEEDLKCSQLKAWEKQYKPRQVLISREEFKRIFGKD